jgi:protein phosphatase-4 regulatory subunit 3
MTHSEVSLFTHLVETLCFFVRHHSYRSKYFLLTENLPARVAQLLSAPEKHLKLTALKFFRTCVGLKDEFYIRHITKNKLLGPILNLVLETMPKDNLINSASLEFFEFIRRDDDLKALINNLVENHRPVLETITYVPTFTMLLQRYDQKPDVNMLPSQYTHSQKQSLNGAARWRGAAREMDPDEEAYFNTSDDEGEGEEEKELEVKQVKIMNGSPNLPLVEYGDDTEEEDEEELANYIANGVRPLRPKPESAEDATEEKESIPERPETPTPKPDASEDMPSSPVPTDDAPVQPPKRRRGNPDEDEDEDALNKLSRSKRRSPAQGAAAQTQAQGQAPSPSPTMGRKRSFNLLSGEPQGNGRTAKKIAISLKSKDGEKDTPSPTTPTAPVKEKKAKEEAKEKEKEEPKVESKLVLKELPEERELAEEKEVEEQLEKEEVAGDKENEKEKEETKDTPPASASDSKTSSGGPEASEGTTEPASTPLSTQKAVEPASS